MWYFTPYYSMLRATTDLMVYVLSAAVALAAVLALWKGRFGNVGKLVVLVGAVVGAIIVLFVYGIIAGRRRAI